MACRHLRWKHNYNVKPREIVKLIMTCVGPGGPGDDGLRIYDEILVFQRNNDSKVGMMEQWHLKLQNNSSPDDLMNREEHNTGLSPSGSDGSEGSKCSSSSKSLMMMDGGTKASAL
ncbi:Alpha-glucan water dikinase [Quillaja saponaria]|uniref:Alpha-glucan water dikinase n=1 Tax=Quillaja saponaria TaxID=32244 RepID=A0AAD7M1A2_QUISA|nr:Alpha-glucan water dikinase [Quillaja saponaria]